MKEPINSSKLPEPVGPYSHGLRVGDFIFTAGQLPMDPKTGRLSGDSIEEQTFQVLENVKAILEAAGATMADVIKCTVHLSDLSLFQRYNAVYERYFPEPRPVRTTVGSQLSSGILIDIDVVAYLPRDGNTANAG
ncbi:MAG: RidA family protein [Chloroflexota bacterium]